MSYYTFTPDGVAVHYAVEGSGEPIVLAHGLSDSGQGLREAGWVDALADRFQVILIDARGHGRSDTPHTPAAYDLQRRVGDVVAVLDDLGIDRAHYAGYSLGGWIGLGMARYAPSRLRSLIVGGAHPYAESMEPFRRVFAAGLGAWQAVVEQAAGPQPELAVARLHRNDVRALAASVADDRTDISEGLSRLDVPCLLYVGGEDERRPLVERAAEVPSTHLAVLPGLNHMQAALRSDVVIGHVRRFLADHAREPVAARV